LFRGERLKPGGARDRGRLRWTTGRSLAIALVPVAAIILAEQSSLNASDNVDVELRIKAAFIYNFARFVEWPAHSTTGPVRIGILGAGDLASSLVEAVRGKTANGRPIEVARISAATEADCCEILLIQRSESKFVRAVVESLAGKPVLTVCDGGNGYRDGVMIAFQLVDDSVRFQINQDAAEHAGLKISSQLLKVAIPDSGKRP
jgi:hypothetical protein